MAAPELVEHDLIQGEDYQFSITFEDDAGDPLNLSGFVVTYEVRDVLGVLWGKGNGVIDVPSSGVCTIMLPKEQTAGWGTQLNLTVRAVGATGNVQYPITPVLRVQRSGSYAVSNPLIQGGLIGISPRLTGGFQ